MLLVLVAIAVYEGLSWGHSPEMGSASPHWPSLLWSLDCLHAAVVVLICTMPDLLLQWVSSLMAASRVVSLVITLLIVTIGGLYMLHLSVLSHVLILASGVLLVRVDLARIRVVPPPLLLGGSLILLVLVGATAGHLLAAQDSGFAIG